VPVAHTCNPSFSEDRDQPRQIVCKTQFRKYTSLKRDGGVAQGVGPEYKPQYQKEGRKEVLLPSVFYVVGTVITIIIL
jgi:hypothetical protein